MQKIKAFLFGVCASILAYAGVAYAQTYPSQPTFLKWGLGIGPNTAEVQGEWGGTTPLGFGVVAQQTDGSGGNIMFLAREAGIEQDTNQFNLGIGANGSRGALEFNAPWGNVLGFFNTLDDGTAGTIALGYGGGTTLIELDARPSIRNSDDPFFDFLEANAAANEKYTTLGVNGGDFEISSRTDADGAGNILFSAARTGTAWGTVALTTAGTASFTSTTDDVTLNAGDGIGDHIILENNAADSTDVDVRGAMFNSTGSLEIFDTLLMSGAIENVDGSAASPAYRFSQDVNTGFYRIGADNVGLSLAGTLSVNYSTAQIMPNYNGTASLPAFSWNTDNDNGMYRIGADNVGFATGGVLRFDISSTALDTNDTSIDDSVDDNVNVAADVSIVGDLVVTGTISGSGTTAVYGGFVDAAATAENLPNGWTAALASSDYTITHNNGAGTNYAVTASHANTNTPPRCNPSITARNTNDFVVRWYSHTDAAACTSNDWVFTMIYFTP